jgi:hypothetical protein
LAGAERGPRAVVNYANRLLAESVALAEPLPFACQNQEKRKPANADWRVFKPYPKTALQNSPLEYAAPLTSLLLMTPQWWVWFQKKCLKIFRSAGRLKIQVLGTA